MTQRILDTSKDSLPDALIPAINSSTCLVAMGPLAMVRIVIFVGESLR